MTVYSVIEERNGKFTVVIITADKQEAREWANRCEKAEIVVTELGALCNYDLN